MPGPIPMAAPLAFQLGAPPDYFTSGHFLDMFDRLLPDSFLEPLKSPGPGYEVYQAFSKIGERMSLAVGRAEMAFYITTAPEGANTIVEVLLSRPQALVAVTVKAGTVHTASASGRSFTQLTDVFLDVGVLGPLPVNVQSVVQDWRWNLIGEVVTAGGEVLPGEIDTITNLIESPLFGDPNIVVYQQKTAYGGQDAALEQHGLDRNLPRWAGENAEAYRLRIRTLPDTVTPLAIVRALQRYLATIGVGIPFDFIETWDIDYQTAYDVTSADVGFDTSLFVYDDPRPAYPPFRNRWLGEEDYRGAFIVVVPNIGSVNDVGMAYDDVAINDADLVSPDTLGTRAMSAYDVTPSDPVPQGAYDGFDLAKQSVYAQLQSMLESIKGYGVLVAIEIRGQ